MKKAACKLEYFLCGMDQFMEGFVLIREVISKNHSTNYI